MTHQIKFGSGTIIIFCNILFTINHFETDELIKLYFINNMFKGFN